MSSISTPCYIAEVSPGPLFQSIVPASPNPNLTRMAPKGQTGMDREIASPLPMACDFSWLLAEAVIGSRLY